jgi:hypothetical protein
MRPSSETNRRRRTSLAAILATALAAALILAAPRHAASDDLVQSGTVSIRQVQIAWIGSANLGGGTLNYNGQTWNFEIGGLGIGGFGVSEIKAHGEVYNLPSIAYFPGAYVQGRYGIVVGDLSAGELWLKNANGVVLHLKADRIGLALSLGGDAIYIRMN